MKVSLFDSRVGKFIESLDKATIAQVLQVIRKLEEFANQIGLPHSKKIGKNIFELRTVGHVSVRLLYCFHDGDAMILHGFIKKTDKIPKKEIEVAVRRLALLRHI